MCVSCAYMGVWMYIGHRLHRLTWDLSLLLSILYISAGSLEGPNLLFGWVWLANFLETLVYAPPYTEMTSGCHALLAFAVGSRDSSCHPLLTQHMPFPSRHLCTPNLFGFLLQTFLLGVGSVSPVSFQSSIAKALRTEDILAGCQGQDWHQWNASHSVQAWVYLVSSSTEGFHGSILS